MEKESLEQRDYTLGTSAFSWVLITMHSHPQELCFWVTFNPSQRLANLNPTEKLVYYRRFSRPFDALAHKHLLENLSIRSVTNNIKQLNPALLNLTNEIIPHTQ